MRTFVNGATGFIGGRLAVVDETYERPGDDFVSYYDETKYLAHRAAVERIAHGAPIVIVRRNSRLTGKNAQLLRQPSWSITFQCSTTLPSR